MSQQNRRPRRKTVRRPKVVYDTPGRECAHADRGCCPRCMNPLAPPILLRMQGKTRRKAAHTN